MRLIVGIIVIFASVIGGYMAMGGHLEVLIQPFEAVIILGAAMGAYVIGNTGPVLKQSIGVFGTLFRGPRYNKESYVELLGLQYSLFRLVQSRGLLALEPHIENPEQSSIFERFPKFAANHHAVEFMCDYLRMVTLGTNNAHELDALMDEELETHHQERERLVTAVQSLADGTPALGIVAAVLGIVKTMGAISEPPEVLGLMIGKALVGTFLGVLLAYGIVGPFAARLGGIIEQDSQFYKIIRDVLVAHLHGNAAQVSVEIGRGSVPTSVQPSFAQLEEALATAAEG